MEKGDARDAGAAFLMAAMQRQHSFSSLCTSTRISVAAQTTVRASGRLQVWVVPSTAHLVLPAVEVALDGAELQARQVVVLQHRRVQQGAGQVVALH